MTEQVGQATKLHQPSNLSLGQPTKFQLAFKRIPNTMYFLQSCNVPGISTTDVLTGTPFVDTYHPGQKLVYDTFNITFLVDSEFRSWFDLHDWLRSITPPESPVAYRQMIKQYGSPYSDATLTINNNANNPMLRIHLVGVFPIQLASLNLDQTTDANQQLVGDCSLRFTYHTIERIEKTI